MPIVRKSGTQLRAEALEDRFVPSTVVALSTNNDLLTFDSSNPK